MFTGLIESVGRVASLHPSEAGLRLTLTTDLASELALGDSLAVNGVCLTVVGIDGRDLRADISPETMRVTTLGKTRAGSLVNLERSLAAGARLGGHFVQGHVDATGIVEEVRAEGESYWLAVRYPSTLARYIVRKGSIAIDGISLTVAAVEHERLEVQIIPFTWQHTNLHEVRAGTAVNLETDILGKYVVRAVDLGSA